MFISIWCEDKSRGIAKDGNIPWKIPADLKLFKSFTINNLVVMGKTTFLTLKKPLPNRDNVVISTSLNQKNFSDIKIYNNLINFYDDYKNSNKFIFIIGGKKIYDFFIPNSDILIVSKVHVDYNCDLKMTNSFKDFDLFRMEKFEDFDLMFYLKK